MARLGSFRGSSAIASKDYISAYDPILNHHGDVIGSIAVGLPQEMFAEMQSAYVKGIIGIAVLALFMASGVGAFIAYVITRPIKSLTQGARLVSSGDLERPDTLAYRGQ